MISEFRNVFVLGDLVKSERYRIEQGQIVSIENHISCYDGEFDVRGIDYDVLYRREDGHYDVDHISEGWLEKI